MDVPLPTPGLSMVALPDGSIDTRVAVKRGGDGSISSRSELSDEILSGRPSVQLVPQSVRPGGQAANAIVQAALLGADARLVGHCDHPAFRLVPGECISLGEPAKVYACEMAGDEFMFAVPSRDIERWSPPLPSGAIDATDAICLMNWATCHSVTDLLPLDVDTVVLDPGNLTGASR
ncbi:MAG: hypothetical protein ABEI52_07940, partial [Halobacteriaceae archaeon]